ncbi:MAG: flagellar basal-body rod protein FlgF [Thermodesulfobacteriota bacterium]|nr:flagellar basal-body rod protein FlgF [Thermodesulfobacteriota bacterium]
MTQAIYTATSAARTYGMRLDTLTHNLSNINTIGFKQDRAIFRTYLPHAEATAKASSAKTGMASIKELQPPFDMSSTLQVFDGTQTDFSSGQLRGTDNPLDLALQGNGFFSIETPEGVQYTRNGNFTLNDEGTLVTQDGLPVLGQGGKITVTGDDVIVDAQGTVSVDGQEVDTLDIADFGDLQALKKVGSTRFAPAHPTVSAVKAEGFGIAQGSLELSNVDPIRVMSAMIEVLRGYESYQKIIKSMDAVNGKAINELGRFG